MSIRQLVLAGRSPARSWQRTRRLPSVEVPARLRGVAPVRWALRDARYGVGTDGRRPTNIGSRSRLRATKGVRVAALAPHQHVVSREISIGTRAQPG